MQAVGKTPAELADDIKAALVEYIEDPLVSVMVDNFQGTFGQQIRIVGATEKPASIPYRANMTLLDAMIALGGLSEYAAGDKRSEEHTSELQSQMRNSYAGHCLKKKKKKN